MNTPYKFLHNKSFKIAFNPLILLLSERTDFARMLEVSSSLSLVQIEINGDGMCYYDLIDQMVVGISQEWNEYLNQVREALIKKQLKQEEKDEDIMLGVA